METGWQTRKILKCICISLETKMKDIRGENRRSLKNKSSNEWLFIAEVQFRNNNTHFSFTIHNSLIFPFYNNLSYNSICDN